LRLTLELQAKFTEVNPWELLLSSSINVVFNSEALSWNQNISYTNQVVHSLTQQANFPCH